MMQKKAQKQKRMQKKQGNKVKLLKMKIREELLVRNTKRNQKGFSLVEILIAITVLSILIIPLLANFVMSSRVNMKAKRILNATTQAQNIMEGISAYGLENTVLQLEDRSLLKDRETDNTIQSFLPYNMTVQSWGEANIAKEADGKLKSINDSFGDQEETKKLVILDRAGGSDDVNMQQSFISRVGEKSFFKESDDHAYAFWMRNVTYGDVDYGQVSCDVLVTFDGEKYRVPDGATEEPLDTTKDIAADSADERYYNSVELSEIVNANGLYDGVYLENATDFSDMVTKLLQPGDTYEELVKHVKRELTIKIERNTNDDVVVSASNTYRVDTSGIAGSGWWNKIDAYKTGGKDLLTDIPTLVYSKGGKEPRNIFVYYYGNYNTASSCYDSVKIVNTSAESGKEETDVNIYLIRMESTDTTLSREDSYHVNVDVYEENAIIPDGGAGKLAYNTKIRTNVGYNIKKLVDDTYDESLKEISGAKIMFSSADSLTSAQVDDIKKENLLMKVAGKKDEDRLFFVTVEIFKEGENFKKDARTGKFTGTITLR